MIEQETVCLYGVDIDPEVETPKDTRTVQFDSNEFLSDTTGLDIRLSPFIGPQIQDTYSIYDFVLGTVDREHVRSNPYSRVLLVHFSIDQFRRHIRIAKHQIVGSGRADYKEQREY